MDGGLKISKMISSEQFYKEIDTLVKNHKLAYLDAVVYFCEKNEIELEVAASMVKSNGRFKSAIQAEGETLNFLPKTAKLPI